VRGPQLAVHAGVSYRTVDHWVRRGYITAGHEPSRSGRTIDPKNPGSGTTRTFTDDEVQVTTLLARLTRAGFDPPIAADIARTWAQDGGPTYALSDDLVIGDLRAVSEAPAGGAA
jgi:DNA-binding transcriptional MerR regulator